LKNSTKNRQKSAGTHGPRDKEPDFGFWFSFRVEQQGKKFVEAIKRFLGVQRQGKWIHPQTLKIFVVEQAQTSTGWIFEISIHNFQAQVCMPFPICMLIVSIHLHVFLLLCLLRFSFFFFIILPIIYRTNKM
jgi:hypothetical protein